MRLPQEGWVAPSSIAPKLCIAQKAYIAQKLPHFTCHLPEYATPPGRVALIAPAHLPFIAQNLIAPLLLPKSILLVICQSVRLPQEGWVAARQIPLARQKVKQLLKSDLENVLKER